MPVLFLTFFGPRGMQRQPDVSTARVFTRAATVFAAVALVLAVAAPTRVFAQAQSASARLRVLMVGNSFSRSVRRPLRMLFRAVGNDIVLRTRARGGWTLGRHLRSAATPRSIAAAGWDWVFLQEQSDGIGMARYDDARALAGLVRGIGARIGFFMTWRDRGASVWAYESLRGEPGGTLGYVPIASELGATVAPVGWAIRNGVAAGMPLDLWRDGHHLNRAGTYLAACVCFATLTGTSPVGLPTTRGLAEAEARYLQSLAATTVFSEPDVWNLP